MHVRMHAHECVCVSQRFSPLGAHEHSLGSLYKVLKPHHQKSCLNSNGLGHGACIYLTCSGDSDMQPWFRATTVSFLMNRKTVHASAK